MVKKEDVVTFLYEGRDDMINFNSKRVPGTPKDFIAQLRLKSGKIIDAPKSWRRKIFKWWHEARKGEIEDSALIEVANQMLGYGKYGTLIK